MSIEYKVGSYYDYNGSKVKIVDIDDRILVKWKDSIGNDLRGKIRRYTQHRISLDYIS